MIDIIYIRDDCVDMINMKMIGRFQRDDMVYYSLDYVMDNLHNYYP